MSYSITDMRTDPTGRTTIPVSQIELRDVTPGDYLTCGLTTYLVHDLYMWTIGATVIGSGYGPERIGLSRCVPRSALVTAWRQGPARAGDLARDHSET
jgi:hypothetical protein